PRRQLVHGSGGFAKRWEIRQAGFVSEEISDYCGARACFLDHLFDGKFDLLIRKLPPWNRKILGGKDALHVKLLDLRQVLGPDECGGVETAFFETRKPILCIRKRSGRPVRQIPIEDWIEVPRQVKRGRISAAWRGGQADRQDDQSHER